MSVRSKSSAEGPFDEKIKFHEGILHPDEFARNYKLHCYIPSEALAPFVEHYFISRRRQQFDSTYVGHDVLSQPVASLFVHPGGAFFHGPTTHRRTLRAKDSPIYVGAQFKPGGFYPFWRRRVSDLAERTIPAAAVIAGSATVFDEAFLRQDDDQILKDIDKALRIKQPEHEPNITLVIQIVTYIEANSRFVNVASIAEQFAISERSLQQLFQRYVGVGVKWAIMRARFLEVTKYARALATPDWASIASDFGYSDQPHFIHDFKRLVGVSPAQYLKLFRLGATAN